jgi:hypothetical protein
MSRIACCSIEAFSISAAMPVPEQRCLARALDLVSRAWSA